MLEDVAQNTSVSELKSLEINKLNEKISSHVRNNRGKCSKIY